MRNISAKDSSEEYIRPRAVVRNISAKDSSEEYTKDSSEEYISQGQ